MSIKMKLMSLLVLVAFLVTGCGVKVEQNTKTLEAGDPNLTWLNYITVEESEKYDITYDASQVNINELGDYTVTYSFTDKESGKVTSKDFKFTVQDTTPPALFLFQNPINAIVGNPFDPLKFIVVKDNYDQLTNEDLTVESNVDTTKEGNYLVTYRAKDSSGNQSEVVLNVNMVAKPSYGDWGNFVRDMIELSKEYGS